MHIRIAVRAVIGSSPRMRAAIGLTAATGSRAHVKSRNPIVAFQNPTTDHGSVSVNRTRKSTAAKPRGGTATTASNMSPTMVAAVSAAYSARRRASDAASSAELAAGAIV